jgi:hypothetical protein
MANEMSYTNYGTKNLVTATSRYAYRSVVHYGSLNKVTFAIYKTPAIGPSSDDKFYEITKEVEFRPDLVSFRFYGLPDFWWRIMEVNKMKDIMEFRAGRNIRLPGGSLM